MNDLNATTARKASNTALAILFIAAMSVPCVGTILKLETGGITGENRLMNPWPVYGGTIKELPREISAWFNDHFGLRNALVRWHSWLKYYAFGMSTSRDVVLGRSPWLFYAHDRILENSRGLIPFTTEELRGWQAVLQARQDWLATQNIRYLFVIAPEKSSIYPEFLTPALTPFHATTRLDQLVAWLRTNSTVEILDLRESLQRAKAGDRVYHWTDTHWNNIGAFAAYREIANCLMRMEPALKPLEISQFDRLVDPTSGGDLAGMLALSDRLGEDRIVLRAKLPDPFRQVNPSAIMLKRKWLPSQEPVVFEYKGGCIPRAVVVHDSFGEQLRPFLSAHFGRVTYIWGPFPPEIITEEKPQIVIEEIVERRLNWSGLKPME